MQEIELKLLLDDAQLRHVLDAPALKHCAVGRRKTQTLSSQYFDTADHALRARGIALRLRKAGRVWIQTVKLAQSPMKNGLSQPLEDECHVPGPDLNLALIADHDLREEVIGLARSGLSVVATTDFKRTSVRAATASGGSADVALDHGRVQAGDRTAQLCELELELIEGASADLYRLAAEILKQGPIRFAETSKSERALALVEPPAEPIAVRKARRLDLSAAKDVETVATAVLAECVGHYMPSLARMLDTEDPSGPHQVRVALRRLRSGLQAFRPALGANAIAPWAEQAKHIAELAGGVRDLDVLIEEILDPMSQKIPSEPGLTILRGLLARRRQSARAAAVRVLAGADITGFGLNLTAWILERGWRSEPSPKLGREPKQFAAKTITKRWAAVKAYGDRIEELTIEERHEMRKALKKLRYVVDSQRSLFDPSDVDAFIKMLRSLQKAFGALNDAAMAEMCLMGPDLPGQEDPQVARAIGRVVGHLEAQADALWPSAVAGWTDLNAMRGRDLFWRTA